MHAGSFHISEIHQTLTWTTGSLTSVGDHSYEFYGAFAHCLFVFRQVKIFQAPIVLFPTLLAAQVVEELKMVTYVPLLWRKKEKRTHSQVLWPNIPPIQGRVQ